MRKLVAFLLVAAVAGCDSRIGPSYVAPLPTIAGTYTLRTVNGAPLPAVIEQTVGSTTTVTADTVTFRTDGSVRRSFTLIVAAPPAAPSTRPSVKTGTYTASAGNVTVSLPTDAGGVLTLTGTYSAGSSVTLSAGTAVLAYVKP